MWRLRLRWLRLRLMMWLFVVWIIRIWLRLMIFPLLYEFFRLYLGLYIPFFRINLENPGKI